LSPSIPGFFFSLASHRLDLPVEFSSPYKVCDFKPALGDIFDTRTRDVDFWGYCDLDIIFGGMREFLTEQVLDQSDIISAARHFMAGPFSLFRNDPQVNRLYRRAKNITSILTSVKCMMFDEVGPYVKWEKTGDYVRDRVSDFESFTDLVLAAHDRSELRTLFGLNYYNDPDTVSQIKGRVLWRRGELVAQGTEERLFMYHFQNGKRSFKSWFIPQGSEWESGLLITHEGFCKTLGDYRSVADS
jgi:hypothetical protein